MKNVFCLILCLAFIPLVSYGESSANIVGCWEYNNATLNISSDGSVKYRSSPEAEVRIGKWQLLDDRLILRWSDGDSDTYTIIKQTSNLMIIKGYRDESGILISFIEVTFDRTCK